MKSKWLLGLALPVAVAGAWLLPRGLPSLCMMKNLWGLSCPGCGMTRSVVALLHGDISGALRFHALGPVVLLLLGAAWGAAVFGKSLLLEHRGVTVALVLFTGALLAYWVIRLLTGTAP